MLAQALPLGACSSFPAQLPPLPLIPQGKQHRGLPQAQCSVWEQERKHRDNSAQHKDKGTQSHIQTEQRGRSRNRNTDLQTDCWPTQTTNFLLSVHKPQPCNGSLTHLKWLQPWHIGCLSRSQIHHHTNPQVPAHFRNLGHKYQEFP